MSGTAFANAANPQPTTVGTWAPGANGSVIVSLTGTWTWPGQDCAGRYGEGWAVDWWGVSANSTPNPNFTLSDVSGVSVTTSGGHVTGSANTTGNTETFAGSLGIPKNNSTSFFHVGSFYNGEVINSPTTCTDTGSGKTATSSGDWSATATYPSAADIPPSICVNMYDEHGSEGSISGSANDFSPVNDGDNSIDTNAFDPSGGAGYCFTWTPGHIEGSILVCTNNVPGSLVSGGTLSATGNTPVGTTANPLASTLVIPGGYTMDATAPAGYSFVTTCGTGNPTSTLTSAGASQSVLVPPNGLGDGIFYVVLNTTPPPPTAPSSSVTPTPTPVPAATTVHTGLPFAGSRPFVAAVLASGLGLLGLGMMRRRSYRAARARALGSR